jgi:hypothetical protein
LLPSNVAVLRWEERLFRQAEIEEQLLAGGGVDVSPLLERLHHGRDEIEEAVFRRLLAMLDPEEVRGERQLGRLRGAVSAAIGFALEILESQEVGSWLPIPAVLREQARLAARRRIGVDVVLRRYCAGQAVLTECVMKEAMSTDPPETEALRRVLSSHAAMFDRLGAAITDDYNAELRRRCEAGAGSEQRRVERVERLLKGESADTALFRYDFSASHVGMVVCGEVCLEQLEALAEAVDRVLFAVCPGKELTWAWLGGGSTADPADLTDLIAARWPERLTVALGEPADGLEGWRLSHRQARAALPVSFRSGDQVVRYADVALLASILEDELLASVLRRTYLEPLENGRGDGSSLRTTLRAYLAAERNVSSAAAALGVTRHTVSSRLRVVEERLGRTLSKCGTELDAALRLDSFEARGSGYPEVNRA